ncbi:MAG: hypothetical protein KatS3mg077_2651 [Candidatus Binatia bacterium]|nr:MAG: hypothetical protein KatS3mg077_2651 [Candidatus Binatia bacterium]
MYLRVWWSGGQVREEMMIVLASIGTESPNTTEGGQRGRPQAGSGWQR